jgi:N-acetyl-anhydromuramyl-L-alanine amidase AmpD
VSGERTYVHKDDWGLDGVAFPENAMGWLDDTAYEAIEKFAKRSNSSVRDILPMIINFGATMVSWPAGSFIEVFQDRFTPGEFGGAGPVGNRSSHEIIDRKEAPQ